MQSMTDYEYAIIIEHLCANGYNTIEDWAEDSDYYFHEGEWYDEDDNPVDLNAQLWHAIEAAQ